MTSAAVAAAYGLPESDVARWTPRTRTDRHIRRCGNCGAWNLIGRLCPTCHIFWHRWACGQETRFNPYSTSGEAPQ